MPEPIKPTGDQDGLTLDEIPSGELPKIDPESDAALDALLAASTGEGGGAATDPEPEIKSKETPKEEPKTVAKEEPKAVAKEEPKAAPADDLDEVPLPPYTKPATAQAFEKLKTSARAKIEAAQKEAATLKADLEKVRTESKGMSEKEAAELAELRSFRQKVDVEADPEFKKFDDIIKTNEETAYAMLKKAGFKDDAIAKIKEIGFSEVDWDSLAAKIPPNVRRYVDAKIVENEDAAVKKQAAIEKAKSNAAEYLKTRSASFEKNSAENQKRVAAQVTELRPKLTPWLVKKTAASDAKPEEKAAVEEHNKFVDVIENDLKTAMEDDSPEMRGILAMGYAQYRRAAAENVALGKQIETIKADHAKEVEAVKADLKKAQDFIDRIKNSSGGRRKESGAPAAGEAKAKSSSSINEHGSDALDRHLAEIQAAKE